MLIKGQAARLQPYFELSWFEVWPENLHFWAVLLLVGDGTWRIVALDRLFGVNLAWRAYSHSHCSSWN